MGSNPISFALRPWASHRYARIVPGLILLLGMFWWTTPLSLASGIGGQVSFNINLEPEIQIDTKVSTQWPMREFERSQGYSILHPGYDLAALAGTRVVPIMSGVVIEAKKSWYGYGNEVLIDHQNGYKSRYGHLSQIWVKAGQEVDLATTLGLSGSTGQSTGPHLHLEIIENDRVVNPKTVLGI